MSKLFWRFVIHLIRKGFGECETRDYDDFEGELGNGIGVLGSRDINANPANPRCPTCAAGQVIEWIETVYLDKN